MPDTSTDFQKQLMDQITRLQAESDQLKKEKEELKKKQQQNATDKDGQHGGSQDGQARASPIATAMRK